LIDAQLSGTPPIRNSFLVALVFSAVLHLLLLFVPLHAPANKPPAARPMQARLMPSTKELPSVQTKVEAAAKAALTKSRILAVAKASHPAARRIPVPQWSTAEKAEMNKFLDELASPAHAPPTLAQRSMAMARNMAQQEVGDSEAAMEVIERLPNSPPVDPFGLEMYMDALVKKLNRSAAYVKNDPRSKGLNVAVVQVKLKPDGRLLSFRVLNMADQQDEIAFIKQVVEQAVPFAAFPSDIQRSAKSLSMLICIQPARAGGGGFGFTRNADGRGC
jgi:hypothetical protein